MYQLRSSDANVPNTLARCSSFKILTIFNIKLKKCLKISLKQLRTLIIKSKNNRTEDEKYFEAADYIRTLKKGRKCYIWNSTLNTTDAWTMRKENKEYRNVKKFNLLWCRVKLDK